MMISGLVYPDNIDTVYQTLLEEKDMLTPKSATYNLQQTTIKNFDAFSKITNKA